MRYFKYLKTVLILFLTLVSALTVLAAQSYRVNTGQTVYSNEFNKDVRNNCSLDIFVPVNTPSEQANFINNKPSCVSLLSVGQYTYSAWSACSVSCGGGTQTRTQTCSYDRCTDQQITSQGCNTQSCSGTWVRTGSTVGSITVGQCGMYWVGDCPADYPSGSCSPIGQKCSSTLIANYCSYEAELGADYFECKQ